MSIIPKIIHFFWKDSKREQDKPHKKLNLRNHEEDNRDFEVSIKSKSVDKPIDFVIPEIQLKVRNQGNIGDCASEAACRVAEIDILLNNPKKYLDLSELFHYYIARSPDFDNSYPQDGGQTIRTSLEVFYKQGVCPEKLDPYNTANFNKKPGLMAYSFSRFYKANKYEFPKNSFDIKHCIANKKAVTIGLTVSNDFCNNSDGFVTSPIDGSGVAGGHATCIIGRNDTIKNKDGTLGAFRVINSWDTNWGDKGFYWLPYSYVDSKYFMGAGILYFE